MSKLQRPIFRSLSVRASAPISQLVLNLTSRVNARKEATFSLCCTWRSLLDNGHTSSIPAGKSFQLIQRHRVGFAIGQLFYHNQQHQYHNHQYHHYYMMNGSHHHNRMSGSYRHYRVKKSHHHHMVTGSRRYLSTDVYERRVQLDVGDAGERIDVHVTWLRDNCTCDSCYNHMTHQRNLLYHQLTSEALEIREVRPERHQVKVIWKDDHVSHYDVTWLKKFGNNKAEADENIKKIVWSAKDLQRAGLPNIDFNDLMKNEGGKIALLESLLRFGVATVVGAPATLEGTLHAARRICKPLWTLYGDHWTFGKVDADDKFEDTAYSNIALGAHTDGTYYINPPGIQILHCLSGEGVKGGESLLVDGFWAAEWLREEDPESFRVLAEDFSVEHVYLDKQYELRSHTKILQLNPATKNLQYIRYNPYDRSNVIPSCITTTSGRDLNIGKFYAALARLGKLIENREAQFWKKLEPGVVLFVDNWRVLHGRAAFTGVRQMAGCYLGRDEWLSAARVTLQNRNKKF